MNLFKMDTLLLKSQYTSRQKKVTNNNKYPYLYDYLIKISRKEQKNIPIIYTGKK